MTARVQQAAQMAAHSVQSVATFVKTPTSRKDYLETGHLFISKRLLLLIAVGIVLFGLLVWFVIWPFILAHFLTARFYMMDSRVENWTGRVIVYADSAKSLPLYEGKLEKGALQGRGKQYDENGVVTYDGAFADGIREGNGTAYQDGSMIYEGDFAADTYNGTGKQYENGMLSYEGTFVNGERSGEGTEYFPGNGPKYKGAFLDGLYEGKGIQYGEDGAKIYEGEFSRGVYSGNGSLYPEKNQRVEAEFTEGEPDSAIKWYKSDKLYYDGESDGLMPVGFGVLYAQNGRTMYTGQMANGTVDGTWLLTLTAQEFRDAMGDADTVEYSDIAGGFLISSPTTGIAALCTYQTAENAPMVRAVYLSEPRVEYFELLPGGTQVSLSDWPDPVKGTREYASIQGVNTDAGVYDSAVYTLDDCQAEVLEADGAVVLLAWSQAGDAASPAALATSAAASEAGQEDESTAEQEALETFLESLDKMAGTGAASAAAGEQARLEETLAALGLAETPAGEGAENPYSGDTSLGDAFKNCASAADAAKAIDHMLDYWQLSEQRAALESNLARAKELLADAQDAVSRNAGSADTVSALTAQQDELQMQINTSIAEQTKAAMLVKETGAEDPAQCDLMGLAAAFNPSELDVADLALIATAYAQAASSGTQTGSEDLALELKTQLADLAITYNDVQAALTAYTTAVSTTTAAAKAYAVGTGSKADWYNAQSAQANTQAAMYAAICAFTKNANALNDMTGGWVSRTQEWLTDILPPLYEKEVGTASASSTAAPETTTPATLAPEVSTDATSTVPEEATTTPDSPTDTVPASIAPTAETYTPAIDPALSA